MCKKISIAFFVMLISTSIYASSGADKPKQVVWPFQGIFGSFDRQAAQRGAQVYFEVCAACHSMQHLYYRNLRDIGFTDA